MPIDTSCCLPVEVLVPRWLEWVCKISSSSSPSLLFQGSFIQFLLLFCVSVQCLNAPCVTGPPDLDVTFHAHTTLTSKAMLKCKTASLPSSVTSCLCVWDCSSPHIRHYPVLAVEAYSIEGNRLSSRVIFVLIFIFPRCCSLARMKFNRVHVLSFLPSSFLF